MSDNSNSGRLDATEVGGKSHISASRNDDAPVLVFRGASHEELEVVRATLVAEGVPAFLNVDSNDPVLGTTDRGVDGEATIGVYVASSNVAAALAIINAPEHTEEDLAVEAALDPKTLEQAEAEVARVP